jgi:drug/metabolite transporter (DMT)-like permease
MRAIGMMLGAVFLLSTMDVAIKQLVAHYGSFQVVFLRCVLSAPLFAAWMLIRERQMFRMQEPANHLLRALLGVVMLFAVGGAIADHTAFRAISR